MASKTVVELVDDLDGGRADETVSFALDGVEYTIDLSAEHATLLRERLAGFVGHARRVEGRPRRTTGDEVVTLTPHAAEAPKTAPAQPRRTKRTTTHRANHAEPTPAAEPAVAADPAPVAAPVAEPVAAPTPVAEPVAEQQPVDSPFEAPAPPAPSAPAAPSAPSAPPAQAGPLPMFAVPFQEASN